MYIPLCKMNIILNIRIYKLITEIYRLQAYISIVLVLLYVKRPTADTKYVSMYKDPQPIQNNVSMITRVILTVEM